MNVTNNINSLHQWQKAFSDSLLNDLDNDLRKTFLQASSNDRFRIYQNNVFYSLTTALADLYPVIKKLVGDNFFMGTANYYIREKPPQHAAMVHFGKDFPAFLRTFEHTQKMQYLADVAEVELAWHQAYHAEDATPLTSEVFNALNAESLAKTTVTFHPSATLLCSKFAIHSIWKDNQHHDISKQDININEPQQVFVVRPAYDVLLFSIDKPMAQLIKKLQEKLTIQSAIEHVLENCNEKDEVFDISAAIQFVIQESLLIHVEY